MQLPEGLVPEVTAGRVVLFLGAGASFGATGPAGNEPPLGDGLRDALSDEFLGGGYAGESLAWVSELSISSANLSRVQDFVAGLFAGLEPADFHKLLPSFKWRGLTTTNYDRLIERVYETAESPVQELVPSISNRDRVDEKLRAPEHMALLKLHGCVTRTHDPGLPLILTTDQYSTHRAGRDRLFNMLLEWGAENTVVFIGHGLQDSDLRTILLEVSRQVSSRPRYYLVKPGASQAEKDLWGEKRISMLDGTFEDFLTSLDAAIPRSSRVLAQAAETEHPIRNKFRVNEPLAGPIKDLLYHDAQYVHPALEYDEGTPERFYKGFDLGWYPVRSGLDVRRRLTDTVLYDVIARPEEDRPTRAELYVVKAEAGAGKTVFLRRVAWEAATQSEALCLFVRPSGSPRFEALRELQRVTGERIFLFVDSAADNVALISGLLECARRFDVPLTLITAERVNEWNMSCDDISGYVSDEYELLYLSRREIEGLVTLLNDHGVQGPNLQGRSLEDQAREFEERAGRQLLVALHEATMGRPFEDILMDEYGNVHPLQARSLYLTVCILHRLRVPVRAGLIARVHDIAFTEFKEQFFAPLEHVVRVRESRSTRDFEYVTRHPEIAQIVFQRALTETTDRHYEYVRILKHLNVSFSSDRESFRKLIKARALHDLFPRYEDVAAIFEVAEDSAGGEPYLYQQMAIYERIRPNGNYARAYELLQKAREMAPRDTSIVHSLAELALMRANNTDRPLERRRLRNEAHSLAQGLLGDSRSGSPARHTLVKLAMDDLRDLLADDGATDQDIDDAVRQVEQVLERGLQEFPDEPRFATAEADFARLLRDQPRSLAALKAAFAANPRDPYIATRLARVYEDAGDLASAEGCLRKALNSNRSDKQLNFRYAEVMRAMDPTDTERLAYHYKRAFTSGDNNHDAQFWYARYAFDSDDAQKRREAKDIFGHLRGVPMGHEARIRVRDRMSNGAPTPSLYTGVVSRIEAAHGFVTVDGRGEEVFLHKSGVDGMPWDDLRRGSRVAFHIGFNFKGPLAFDVRPA